MELISIFYLLDIIVLTILFCKHVVPILLQYVAQTIISIDNYCNTEFKKLWTIWTIWTIWTTSTSNTERNENIYFK